MPYKGKNSDPNAEFDAMDREQAKKDALRRVKITREKLINPGAVLDGDPSKHYVWVNRAEARQNNYASLGYIPCKSREISETESAKATEQKKATLARELKRKGLSDSAITKEVENVRAVKKWPVTRWERTDGTHVRGDLILYEVDKDDHEALLMLDEQRGLELLDAPKDNFKAFAAGIRTPDGRGVPVFDPSERQ